MSDLPKIILTLPSGEVRKYSVQMDSIRIGRAPDNTVVMDDGSLSSHHAVLHRRDNGYELLDLGSTNGLEFNGQRVLSHMLSHGQEIKIGSVMMRFEWPDMPGLASADAAATAKPSDGDAAPSTEAADAAKSGKSDDEKEKDKDKDKSDEDDDEAETDGKPSFLPASLTDRGGCFAAVLLFVLTLLAPVVGLHLRHYAETRRVLVSDILQHRSEPKPAAPAATQPE